MRQLGVFISMALALLPGTLMAQYVVGSTVIAGGGARLTGGGYVVTATAGQSAPIGISSGGSYITHHGFWYAVTGTGGGGLDPMVLDIDLISATTCRISWAAVTGATNYDLYRSATPFFQASGPYWRTVVAPATHTNTTSGIGNANTNYFFIGIARNASDTSLESNIVGEIDFMADIPLFGQGTSSGSAATQR